MKKEDDPLYMALHLIDVNFNWRTHNYSTLIDEINYNDDYSWSHFTKIKSLKDIFLGKVIKIGYPDYKLSDEEIFDEFLKYAERDFLLTNIYDKVSSVFKGNFVLNKDHILALLDIAFLIPNHITNLLYAKTVKLKSKIPKGKLQEDKYRAMAYVKKTLETMRKKQMSLAYSFLDIKKTTFYDWYGREVNNKKNKERFSTWKSETPDDIITFLEPLLHSFVIKKPKYRGTHNIRNFHPKLWIEGFSNLLTYLDKEK